MKRCSCVAVALAATTSNLQAAPGTVYRSEWAALPLILSGFTLCVRGRRHRRHSPLSRASRAYGVLLKAAVLLRLLLLLLLLLLAFQSSSSAVLAAVLFGQDNS